MKKLLLLLVLGIGSLSPAVAQSAADGLDTTLVAYYRWCNRHKRDPEMPLKADTMFRLAGERQNRRMQAVALCLKTDYYYYTNDLDSIKAWVRRTQEFTRKYDQLTHYYFVWTRLITYYSKFGKYTLAQYELERLRDQAVRDNYKPGLAEAYKQLGYIYRTKSLYDASIDSYAKAIEIAEENDIKEVDISYLYIQMGELYTMSKDFDKADEAFRQAERTILLPEHIWRIRLAQANRYAGDDQFDRASELLRDIRRNGKNAVPEDRIENVELAICKGTGDYRRALEIANKQLALYDDYRRTQDSVSSSHYFYITSLGIRAGLHYLTGNYLASANDLSMQIALIRKKYDSDNRETLNEFATLLDVERLDREKVEAQQLAQTERLRRARVVGYALAGIILLAGIFILVLTRMNRHLAHAKRAAEQANHMKSVFIRNITHEINTPLNAIVGFSELASTVPEDDPERDAYIGIIRENSGYLQKLVDDVLYIADLESSETPPVREETDIEACCRTSIRTVERDANTAGIRFEPGAEGFRARTSGALLTKALTELLRNAARFSQDPSAIVLSYAVAPDRGCVTFAVEDNGPGIPEAERERVFERFVKLDPFYQGMGLGLSVSRMIARALGGDVDIDPDYTHGARFRMTIPVA